VKYTKTRNEYLVLLSSILTVIVLYVASHYMRYVALSAITALQAFGDFSDKSLEAGKIVVEYAIKQETGYSGFIGYMIFKAQQGISIGKIYSSYKLNLGPIITWIYWLIELGIIGFITINTSKQILKKPFCEFCNSWYTEKKHIGGVPLNRDVEILNLIKQKEFANAGAILEENAESPSLELYLQGCKSCDTNNSTLSIASIKFVNGKIVSKEISDVVLKPNEKKLLMQEIKFHNN